jgi:ATPase family associated with various cellular activities (AAA)
MYYENHTFTLIKPAHRALQERAIEGNLTRLLASINTKSLAVQGWRFERNTIGNGWSAVDHMITKVEIDTEYRYEYRLHLVVGYEGKGDNHPGKYDLHSLARKVNERARQPQFGGWILGLVDDNPYEHSEDDVDVFASQVDEVGYATVTIPDDFEDYFGHLYGLQPHIGLIRRALEAGMNSQWKHRLNCALIGPPGCGKSDICGSLKKALGDDAVMNFDATATTSAGAIKELLTREILPRVIVIEEIEKASDKSFEFLLGILDLRGEIRKTTARDNVQRDTKLFAVATVNNYEKFQSMLAGALASRFSQKIGFKRPSRETLAQILKREIDSVNGDERWITPTLDYCDGEGITDPRQVIAIALCGREMLLTGEYQKMLEATAIENIEIQATWIEEDSM